VLAHLIRLIPDVLCEIATELEQIVVIDVQQPLLAWVSLDQLDNFLAVVVPIEYNELFGEKLIPVDSFEWETNPLKPSFVIISVRHMQRIYTI
jgi:hypothetical protein